MGSISAAFELPLVGTTNTVALVSAGQRYVDLPQILAEDDDHHQDRQTCRADNVVSVELHSSGTTAAPWQPQRRLARAVNHQYLVPSCTQLLMPLFHPTL